MRKNSIWLYLLSLICAGWFEYEVLDGSIPWWFFAASTIAITHFYLQIYNYNRKSLEVEKTDKEIERQAERRTKKLLCTITKVQRKLDAQGTCFFQIICDYTGINIQVYQFKTPMLEGKCSCKEGETIEVLVDPADYNNYYVVINDYLL